MSVVRSCHHYFLGDNVCRFCGHDKTPGTLLDRHGVVHRAAWKDSLHSCCLNGLSYPERVLTMKKTRRKVVTCLTCTALL